MPNTMNILIVKILKPMIRLYGLAGLILGSVLLTACTIVTLEAPKPESFHKVEQSLYRRLSAANVKFVQLGDEVKIILPYNSWFFSEDSLFLSSQSIPLLEDMIRLLNSLDYLRLTLKVYANSRYASVAHQQAIVLADYLIHHGLDSRLLGNSYILEKSPMKIRVAAEPHIELSLRLLHSKDMD